MLASRFNKVAGLKALDFTEKKLQHRSFPVIIAKFPKAAFLRTPLMSASVHTKN